MNENEIIEEWRPIEGYENYQVSNYGRVKSLGNDKTRKEKILKQGKKKDGYLQVNLYKEGKMKPFLVHRLVATAFLDNPSNLHCVNHKDEDKTNNCVENLEWCTHQYNSNYRTCQQRRVASTDYQSFQARRVASTDWKAIAEKLSKQVYQYDKYRTLVAIWESTNEAGRNGFCKSHISACCNGKLKSHKGYIWSYNPL